MKFSLTFTLITYGFLTYLAKIQAEGLLSFLMIFNCFEASDFSENLE